MSGLSIICDYGCDSDSDEIDDYIEKRQPRNTLPVPDLSKVEVIPKDNHVDDPALHDGRIRSFPYIRGNWPTFVYIKYPEHLEFITQKLQNIAASIDVTCKLCTDFHVSLSQTVVLTYHLITSFTSSLQEAVGHVKSFSLGFNSIMVYCNEERTRTFVALKTDCLSNKLLLELTKNIDKVMKEYRLPTFYEDPSFHMSILWVNGDKQKALLSIVEHMNEIVAEEIGKSLFDVLINNIHCKSGNKYFQYSLQ